MGDRLPALRSNVEDRVAPVTPSPRSRFRADVCRRIARCTPAQADALTDALREFTEQGDHVTPDQFKVGLAEVRTEIANLDTRLSAQIGDVRTEVTNLDTRLSTQIAGVRTEIASLETRLIRWMGGTENTNDEEQEPIRVNTREEFDAALEWTASLLARPRAWLRHERANLGTTRVVTCISPIKPI